jgi:hypothetical protein
LKLAATRSVLPGATVQGRRLIPDPDYKLVMGKKKNTILLEDALEGAKCEYHLSAP